MEINKSFYGYNLEPNYFLNKDNYNEYIYFSNEFLDLLSQIRTHKKEMDILLELSIYQRKIILALIKEIKDLKHFPEYLLARGAGDIVKLKSNKIRKIKIPNKQIGFINIIRLYEQITVSPEPNNYQIFVNRTRYYFKKEAFNKISIASVISDINILLTRSHLINIH